MSEIPDNVTVTIGGVKNTIILNRRDRTNPFSSGSIGYHGQGKIMIGDKKHQCNFLLVEVGSKNKKTE